ncbi:MAG TPA: hypothetical protein VEU76_00760 [Candidatus Udaeobacter sp.]|nr:hypothetical protein [Candidatus Udaeobacter sp.]
MLLLFSIGELLVVVAVVVYVVRRISRSTGSDRRNAVIGLVALLLVSLPVTVAWALWIGAAARCVTLPVAGSRFMAADAYDVVGDSNYNVGLWPIVTNEYFCTTQDAEAAGMHPDPLR